jgi:hypothetical protein
MILFMLLTRRWGSGAIEGRPNDNPKDILLGTVVAEPKREFLRFEWRGQIGTSRDFRVVSSSVEPYRTRTKERPAHSPWVWTAIQ